MQACSNCAGDYEDPDRTAVPGDLSEQSEGDDVDEVGEVEVEVEVDDVRFWSRWWRSVAVMVREMVLRS